MKGTGASLALASFPLVGCAGLMPRTPEETLRDYKGITKNWDSVYGPSLLWFSKYGGRSDFKGHERGGVDKPGVDYDVPIGTPIVPPASCILYGVFSQRSGGLVVGMDHSYIATGFYSEYAHLSEKRIGEGYRRSIPHYEIFALSGDSGLGPLPNGKQPEHLHFGFMVKSGRDFQRIDPEKYGIDGGKPVLSDVETDLGIRADKRLSALGSRLDTLARVYRVSAANSRYIS